MTEWIYCKAPRYDYEPKEPKWRIKMKKTLTCIAALLLSTGVWAKPQLPFDPLKLNSRPAMVLGADKLLPVSGCLPSDTKCTMQKVVDNRSGLIQDLLQADQTQAAVINSTTGEAWDPYLHVCLMGTPAQGEPGQPGFVAAQGGLVEWLTNLKAPTLSSVPALPENASVATLAEHARLLVIASQQDVNMLVAQINAGGFPNSVRQPCAGFLQDAFVAVPASIAAQAVVINGLLLKYLPK